jgi:hypothetical protein
MYFFQFTRYYSCIFIASQDSKNEVFQLKHTKYGLKLYRLKEMRHYSLPTRRDAFQLYQRFHAQIKMITSSGYWLPYHFLGRPCTFSLRVCNVLDFFSQHFLYLRKYEGQRNLPVRVKLLVGRTCLVIHLQEMTVFSDCRSVIPNTQLL